MSFEGAPFRSIGTPVFHWTLAASTSAGYQGQVPAYFSHVFSQWSMRVRMNGAPASSGQVQLRGTIATSSEGTGPFKALTTWDGGVNSSDDVLQVTGKPLTAVVPYLATPSSSGTSIDVWIAGSA